MHHCPTRRFHNAMTIRCFHIDDHKRDWASYQSKPPQTREELMAASHLILGHFTSTTFLDGILKSGLLPDFDKARSMDDRVPSDFQSVYLTAKYDRFYGERAVKYHDGSAVVVEVIVSTEMLQADEGALSPAELAKLPPDLALYESLCCSISWACKHAGAVPLSQILSITHQDGTPIYEAVNRQQHLDSATQK